MDSRLNYLRVDVGGTIRNPVLNDDEIHHSLSPDDYSIPDRVHIPTRGEYLLEVFGANVHSILRGWFHP